MGMDGDFIVKGLQEDGFKQCRHVDSPCLPQARLIGHHLGPSCGSKATVGVGSALSCSLQRPRG